MVDELRTKPARLWTLEDLAAVVSGELSESYWLELKQDLSTPSGGAGWRKTRTIHNAERDAIAKELVAFANAYGGVLIIGIIESPDHPKRAHALFDPLPDVFDLLDRLRMAITSTIDPPLPGIDIAAIAAGEGATSGYIVATVGSSLLAPHGFGRPPLSYIRRDDKSEPMAMRDLQSVFWEARTRRERIEEEFSRSRTAFDVGANRLGVLRYQFTVVSEQQTQIANVIADLRSGSLIKSRGSFTTGGPANAAILPVSGYDWKPTGMGAEHISEITRFGGGGTCRWEIDETGVLTVGGSIGVREGRTFYPGWFSKACGTALGLTELIVANYQLPGAWLVAGVFQSLISGLMPRIDDHTTANPIDLSVARSFRPIRVESFDD